MNLILESQQIRITNSPEEAEIKTIQRKMSNMIKQGIAVPKLAKTKQLQNPYQSNISTSTQISRIFLLNDRNRIRLTESSDTESEEEVILQNHENINKKIIRGYTFSKPTGQFKTQSVWHEQQLHDNSQQQVSTGMKNPEPLHHPFAIGNRQKNALTPEFPTNTKITSPFKSQNKEQDKQAQHQFRQMISAATTKQKFTSDLRIKKQVLPVDVQQQIANQNFNEDFIKKVKMSNALKVSIAPIEVPVLEEGSPVMSDREHGSFRQGSIIDKIRQQHFMESNVFQRDSKSKQKNQTKKQKGQVAKGLTERKEYFRNEGQQKQKQRQRTKIFANTSKKPNKLSPQKQEKTNYNYYYSHEPTAIKPDYSSNYYDTPPHKQKKDNQTNIQSAFRQKNMPAGSYAICPHTQCIYKSLEIIDKLTNNQNLMKPVQEIKSSHNKKEQNYNFCNLVQTEALDLSLRADRLVVELILPDLAEQQTSVRIAKLKYEVEKLLEKLKKIQVAPRTIDSSLSQTVGMQSHARWELCKQFQNILKSLHYIEITQQRYKMWKLRLYHLSQRIKHVHEEDYNKLVTKSVEIGKHISELDSSKMYGQACSINVVESFNQYLQNEKKQLAYTLDWIKETFFNKKTMPTS